MIDNTWIHRSMNGKRRKTTWGTLFFLVLAPGILGLDWSRCHGNEPDETRPGEKMFRWPQEQQCAVSLTYDDAVPVHYQAVGPALEKQGLTATFYVTIRSDVQRHPQHWRKLAARGHELGNHSLFHPCRGADAHKSWLPAEYDLMKYTPRRFSDRIASCQLGAPLARRKV